MMNLITPVPPAIASRLISPSAYSDRAQLFDDFKWLRSNQPIGCVETEEFDPFILVTRHDDVLAVSRSNDLFINSARPAVLMSKTGEAAMRARTGHPWYVRLLIHRDGPDHWARKRIVQDWFTPKRMVRIEQDIRTLARNFVSEVECRDGRCDVVTDIGMRFAARVLMLVIGMPPEDEDFLLDVTQRLFTRRGPSDGTEAEPTAASREQDSKRAEAAMRDFVAYFETLTSKRRVNPTDDLASAIAQAQIDGGPIAQIDAAALYLITLTAGHESTAATLAGAVWGLCQYPSELKKLRSSPVLIPAMIEEAVRWTSPIGHFMRTASRGTKLGGYEVQEGAWIMMSYISANRDEGLFEDADAFVIDRASSSKVAFGSGTHGCVGQHLARLELRIFFEELLPRLKGVETSGRVQCAKSLFLGGPSSLPVAFHLN